MMKSDIAYFLRRIESDSRLNVWHMAILVALLMMGINQGRIRQIKVSRSQIMAASHIATCPTYHKYFKELQELGYICYRPSYHPGVRSEVDLIKQP